MPLSTSLKVPMRFNMVTSRLILSHIKDKFTKSTLYLLILFFHSSLFSFSMHCLGCPHPFEVFAAPAADSLVDLVAVPAAAVAAAVLLSPFLQPGIPVIVRCFTPSLPLLFLRFTVYL